MSTLKTDKLYSTDRSTGSDENILLNDDGTTNLKGNTTVTGTCTATTFSGSGASLTNLPAANLTGALPAISGASLTGISSPLSFRNKIINGAATIRQRPALTGWNNDGKTFVHDRWALNGALSSATDIDVIDSPSPPLEQGFNSGIQIKTTGSTQTPGTNDELLLRYAIEGQDVQDLKFGTSSAEALTLSFWCKTSTNAVGQYGVQLMITDKDGSGHEVHKSFTTTNTDWTKYTLTFPGTGSITSAGESIKNDNSAGLYIYICLASGSGNLPGAATDTWAASGSYAWPTGQTNFLDANPNEIDFTGFQLEVGSTATAFEHKPYGEELARCQRYYYMHVTHTAADSDDKHALGQGSYYTSTEIVSNVSFPTAMRAKPTLESTNSSTGGGAFVAYRDGTTDFFNLFYGNKMEYTHGEIHNSESSQISGTAGHGCLLRLNQDAGDGTKLAFTAEI